MMAGAERNRCADDDGKREKAEDQRAGASAGRYSLDRNWCRRRRGRRRSAAHGSSRRTAAHRAENGPWIDLMVYCCGRRSGGRGTDNQRSRDECAN
jgi:hypothetical protein